MKNKQIKEELARQITDEFYYRFADRPTSSAWYQDVERFLKQSLAKQKQQILTLIKEKNKSDNVIENYDDIIKGIEKI